MQTNTDNTDGDLKSTSDFTSCGTRKSRDKRENRHSVGIFVGAFQCGTIVLFEQLYGSEGIAQVSGFLMSFFSRLGLYHQKIIELLYDDNCHLEAFVNNK